MNETLVTIVGNVASTVTYGQTSAGVPVANFRMATTERRFDRAAGDWVDGETSWVTVVAWRWLATNLVSSVTKGDPVLVSGRLRVREWGEDDRRRTSVEIDARSVGHDLSRGTSAFRWAVRGRSDPQGAGSGTARPARADAGGPTGIGEAVPEWIVAAVGARRAAEQAAVQAAERAAAGATDPAGGAGAAAPASGAPALSAAAGSDAD
ncbi:hypothetical protein KNE206_71560 [Kitasatospora sp. NE20-6]|uniref:single-stranded DNA-binding protein n=1 Tax=Kitasatospora sp. NE20-6 TaxID=2859066 RepID=UPI0034DB94EC